MTKNRWWNCIQTGRRRRRRRRKAVAMTLVIFTLLFIDLYCQVSKLSVPISYHSMFLIPN